MCIYLWFVVVVVVVFDVVIEFFHLCACVRYGRALKPKMNKRKTCQMLIFTGRFFFYDMHFVCVL